MRKRAVWFFALVFWALLCPPLEPVVLASAPPTRPAVDIQSKFAPGSIVRFDHLTIEDGLSQNAGLALFQDRRGYLWIGTQDGLNRYDGYQFKTYKHDLDNADSLSYNSIISIGQDSDGMLWVGTWGGGLNRFDAAAEKFTVFKHDPQDAASLSNDTVTAIYQDSRGTLWIGTLGGLDRLNSQTGKFEHLRNDPANPNSLGSDAISTIVEDAHGILWIGTGGWSAAGAGLNRLDPSTGQITRYQHDDANASSINSNTIAEIFVAPDETLWIAMGGYGLPGNGLDHFDPRTGQAIHFVHNDNVADSLTSNNLMTLYGDASGELWLGTWDGGLDVMNLSNPGHFVHFRNDPYIFESIASDNIWSLFRDRSGILWVGNANKGIDRLSDSANRFGLYRHNPSDPNSLGMDAIGAFAQTPDGAIWIGTWGVGLERFDPATGRMEHFKNNSQDASSIGTDLILTMSADAQGILWIGTMGAGLDRFDSRTGTFRHYRHDEANPNSPADDRVMMLAQDHSGAWWLGTLGGLDRFDPETETFVHYAIDPDPASASNKAISLAVGPDNVLWIGSWGGGLHRLDLNDPLARDPKTARYTSYRHEENNPASLSQNSVFSIFIASDGLIWLGTEGGLNRFEVRSNTFKHYTEKDGLSNATISGILQDAQGKFWLTTNNGLDRFDPAQETFTVYNASDGLQSNEFNANAYLRDRDGNFYVGGIHGFNVFNPDRIQTNSIPPQVAITDFQIFNNPVSVDLSGKTPIQLAYQQNFISFEFAALDYNAPQKNQYAYKLDGFDKDWIDAGTRRYASYTNLPGRNYVLRVKGANSDGVWSTTETTLPIEVQPPFWQTVWFGAAVAALLIGGMVVGFRWRVRAIRENARQLEALVAQRTVELSESKSQLEIEVEQRKRAEAELAKRAEHELHQSEERFRAAFASSAIGMALTTLDGIFLKTNAAIQKMSGYTEQELENRNQLEVSFPEDAEVGRELSMEIVEGKRDYYQVERRFLRKNGEIFWARLTLSAVHDAQGKTDYFVALIEDIDAQKRTFSDLKKSEARFQAVFENAAVGITLLGLDGKVMAVNPVTEQIVGYTATELRETNPLDLMYMDDRGRDAELYQELITGKRSSYVSELRFRRKDEALYWVRVNYSMVLDPEGKPDYLIALVENIDKEKRAAEKLAEQEAEYRRTLEQRIAERTQELNQANALLQQKAAQDAANNERTRLARDLHDAVTQTLFSASLIAEVLPTIWEMNPTEGKTRLEELRQLTRGALAEMRMLLVELRPNALTQMPLPDLLRQLCESVIGRDRLPIQLSVEGERKLVPNVQIALYRIAQEALNNVVKHAKATQATVTLRMGEQVRLVVADNGFGFHMAQVPADHFGLKIMRERADSIGAVFSIHSEPNEGTQISVTWQEQVES